MVKILIIDLVVYLIAGFRDAGKSMHKYWQIGKLMVERKISFKEAKHLYENVLYNELSAKYNSHDEGWHWQTTSIWVVLLTFTSYLLDEWGYMFLSLDFLQVDMNYYVFTYFISGRREFLPKTLNWLTVRYGEIFGYKFRNPINRIWGDEFTKKEFIIFWLILKAISYYLTYITVQN